VKQKKLQYKFHNKLWTVVEQHIIAFAQKCFPMALKHALKQTHHWTITWSI